MSHEPGLFPLEPPQSETSPAPQNGDAAASASSPVWLQRLSIVVLVVFCFYVGLLLFLLPWTRYWNENHYLIAWPSLSPWIGSGFVRGLVSGLGLLDVWIGIAEVVYYREHGA